MPPEKVTAPKQRWHLIKVLRQGTSEGPESYSIAVGRWDGNPCVAIRWNANEDRPVGNPHSRGLPTWFILPDRLHTEVLGTLPRSEREFAAHFFSAPVTADKSKPK